MRSSTARVAIARIGCAITVSGGSSSSAHGGLSTEMTAMSSGIRSPAQRMARMAPSAIRLLATTRALTGPLRPTRAVAAEAAVSQHRDQPCFLDRGEVSLLALAARLDFGAPADKGDARMARVDQAPRRGPDGRDVIRHDRVSPALLEGAVDRHDGDGQVTQMVDAALRIGRRQHDPADALIRQHLQARGLPVAVLIGVADQDPVAASEGNHLDDAAHLGEMRILDVGNDDADRVHLLTAQVAGQPVGPVAQRGGGGEHPLAQFRIDPRIAVEHTGYGRHRHEGQLGDIPDPGRARAPPWGAPV
jgi:hypothetical protein